MLITVKKFTGIRRVKYPRGFINHLEEQISFLREQLRNKDKIINSLLNQFSKNSELIQTPIINPQEENLFLKTAKENTTPVKQKLLHNTEAANNQV